MAQKTSAKKSAKNSVKKTGVPAARKAAAPAKRPAPAPKHKAKPAAKAVAKKAVVTQPTSRTPAGAGAAKALKKEKPVLALSKSELQYFRNLLLEKRRELLGDVGSMESEAFKSGSNLSNMPIHMADVGTDNFEQEFTLGLIESERHLLRDIQEALVRLDDGGFGVCLGTGKLIPRVRLEAVPWAKYTIEYLRLLESGKISRDNGSAGEEETASDEEDD